MCCTTPLVLCTPRSLTLWCYAHRGVWLCGVMHTAESDYVVLCTPRSLTLWCFAHRGVWLYGVMHIVVYFWQFDFVVWCFPRKNSQVLQRILKYLALRCTPQSFWKVRLSRENRNRNKKYFRLFISTDLGPCSLSSKARRPEFTIKMRIYSRVCILLNCLQNYLIPRSLWPYAWTYCKMYVMYSVRCTVSWMVFDGAIREILWLRAG